MTLIAHLSDTHVLEEGHASRSAARRRRLSFLSLGRALDARDRAERLRSALRAADRARADHIVITGDLTEDGDPAQFDVFAELLSGSGIEPDRISFIPGNHDAYDSHDGYEKALSGPLHRWRHTSTPGQSIEIGEAVLLPISTAIHQHWLWARGAIPDAHFDALGTAVRGTGGDRTLVVLQHHPPSRRFPILQAMEGLRDHARIGALLHNHPIHVLHGHTHIPSDRSVRTEEGPRIFCAPAVVDHRQPLRLYRAHEGRLSPVDDRSSTPLVLPVFIPRHA